MRLPFALLVLALSPLASAGDLTVEAPWATPLVDTQPAPALPAPAEPPPFEVPLRSREEPPIASMKGLPSELDLVSHAKRDASNRLVLEQNGQQRALTVDAQLQDELNGILRNYAPPYAAVVAIEPGTGRMLAMAERSEVQPKLRGLTTAAVFPAASVFKMVTSAALLDRGVGPGEVACFHGGKRRLSQKSLADSPRDRCTTMANALAFSTNGAFAKLTVKHLEPAALKGWAEAFHFNKPFPFPIPTETSSAVVPEDELGFAQAGAGFGDVFMSPLHAAAIGAVPANRGVWRSPVLFEDEVSTTTPGEQVMTPDAADALAGMMEETVTQGTARRIFRERGMRVPGAVGKTGSLIDRKPFRDYTWFVGYAPRDNPQIAVAAMIVNDYHWRIRATWLAREAMRLYLAKDKKAKPSQPTADAQTN